MVDLQFGNDLAEWSTGRIRELALLNYGWASCKLPGYGMNALARLIWLTQSLK